MKPSHDSLGRQLQPMLTCLYFRLLHFVGVCPRPGWLWANEDTEVD